MIHVPPTFVPTLGEVGDFGDMGCAGSLSEVLLTGPVLGCLSCSSRRREALASVLWVMDPPLTSAFLQTTATHQTVFWHEPRRLHHSKNEKILHIVINLMT